MCFKWNYKPRFKLDSDNDIIDEKDLNVYDYNLKKDWERLCILLNSLNLQKEKAVSDNDKIVSTIKQLYEEYSNYIDEYSLMKVDIIMSIAEELNIDLD